MPFRPRSRSSTEAIVAGKWRARLAFRPAWGEWIRRQWEEELEQRTGFLLLPIAFGLGIIVYFSAIEEPAPWAGPALLALAGIGIATTSGLARLALIGLAFLAAGFSAGTLRTALVQSPMLDRGGIYTVSGFLEAVDASGRRHRMTLRVTALDGGRPENLPHRLRIGGPGAPPFLSGTHVTLKARLSPPSEASMPGGYDFRRDSYFRSVGGVGYAIGRIEATTPRADPDAGLRFNAMIDRWRNALTDRIARAIGGDAGALAAALVTGKRGLISNETNDDLRGSGLYHIVSISGLHMVLAAGVMFWSLRAFLALFPAFALRHPIKKYAAFGAMLGTTAYCIFSGSEVATERSLIMMLVMLGAILVDRPALAMRNVAISALIVLAREPESLLGPSFQMSYAAVTALIAGNEIWRRWRPEREPTATPRGFAPPGWISRMTRALTFAFLGIVATTLLASLATAPFSAFHFHRINPYGLIGNALAIPLVSLVVMPSAVIGTLLVPFGLDGLVWMIMGEGMRGVLFVAHAVAGLEGAAPPVARMPGHLFGLLVLALLVVVVFRSKLRWISVPIVLVWFALLSSAPLPDLMLAPDGRMALFRGEGGRYTLLSPANPSSFTLQQWLPALGDARLPADPTLRKGTRCDRQGCTGRTERGELIALSLTAEAVRLDCQRASIILTPAHLSPAICETGRLLLTGADFEAYGAQRLWVDGARMKRREASLGPQSRRPWRKDIPLIPESQAQTAASEPQAPSSLPRRNDAPGLPEDDPALQPPPQ